MWKIRAFTFRISKPLLPPEITEDNVDFTPSTNTENTEVAEVAEVEEVPEVKGFAFDFSYVTFKESSGNFSH